MQQNNSASRFGKIDFCLEPPLLSGNNPWAVVTSFSARQSGLQTASIFCHSSCKPDLVAAQFKSAA